MGAVNAATQAGWLKGRQFDLTFIVGIPLLALVSGLLVVAEPSLFFYVLTADLWLLGYHHVASTYTRLAFDMESAREHRFKLTVLPVLVAVSVTIGVLVVGPWMLATIYLYWQWYHYTRQSEGISKAYGGKSKMTPIINMNVNRFVFWFVPVAGLLIMSARNPDTFLYMPVETLPVPLPLATVLGFLAVTSYLWWLVVHVVGLYKNKVSVAWFMYMNSHFLIYAFAYVFIENLNHGWLIINIWHNAQYILFVWLYNNNRFNGELSERHMFISTISKNKNLILYLFVCFALSSAVYQLLDRYGVAQVEILFGVSGAAAAMIIYQTINFHHYIVDASIWKLRKKGVRENLRISS